MRETSIYEYHFYKKETGFDFDPYYYYYEPVKVNDDNDINLFVMQTTDGDMTLFGSTRNKHYSDIFFSVYNVVVETASMEPHKKGDVYAKIVSDKYIELGTFSSNKDGKKIGHHYRYLISKYNNIICEEYDGEELIKKTEYNYKIDFFPRVKPEYLKVKEGNYTICEDGKKIKELCDGGCSLSNFRDGIGLKFENFGIIYGIDRKSVELFIFDSEKGVRLIFNCYNEKVELLINKKSIKEYKIIKQ